MIKVYDFDEVKNSVFEREREREQHIFPSLYK